MDRRLRARHARHDAGRVAAAPATRGGTGGGCPERHRWAKPANRPLRTSRTQREQRITMNKFMMTVIFIIGLVAVGWVGWGFVGASWMALTMTAVIGGVYILGALELRRFRAATNSLSEALAQIPSELTDLSAWLQRLHPSLQHPVRLRIEGQRVAMPGPALTPYLVGLLVMLGMLGTFLGMMSAMCRRERIEVVRQLDAHIATTLRPLSGAHQRDATFKALQAQADAMPVLVDRLQALMTGLERRSEQLDAHLLAQQQAFHREASAAYTDLAKSVGTPL